MECKQPHYFFIILGEDSWGILTVISCEKMIIGSCITAKVISLTITGFSSAAKALQEQLEAASSCFANNPEMIYLHTKILLVIKPM